MTIFIFIMLALSAAVWFFLNEAPRFLAVFMPANIMRKSVFAALALATFVLCLGIAHFAGAESAVLTPAAGLNRHFALIAILSSITVLAVMLFSGLKASFVLALLGAMAVKCKLNIPVLLASPLAAFLLSALLTLLFKKLFEKSKMHFIKFSFYIRFALIAVILSSCAVLGANWGFFLLNSAGMLLPQVNSILLIPVCAVVLAVCVVPLFFLSYKASLPYEELPVYSMLASGLAVALSAAFVTNPVSIALNVSVSVFASGLVSGRAPLFAEQFAKDLLATVLAPCISFLLCFLLLLVEGDGAAVDGFDYLLLLIAFVALICACFGMYLRAHRKQKEVTRKIVESQRQQIYENKRALNDMELKVILSENQALRENLAQKRNEVMNIALSICEQKEYLSNLQVIAQELKKTDEGKRRDELISELDMSIKQRLSYERDVDTSYFYARAESLHEDFNAKLAESFPELTPQERRLATLLRLGFSSKYIATLMNITPKSVEISRYRLRQKLKLDKGDNLVNYIQSI